MARPSAHLDRKLVDAARAMLPERGLAGLSIREVSRRAGVNVGMFHYHFKSKKAFQRRVLQECYEDFFAVFSAAADGPGRPRERLRRLLVGVARFARENRLMLSLMLGELIGGQRAMGEFARRNFPRHAAVAMRLFEECRREGSVRDLPAPLLAAFAMPAMGLPSVIVTAFERNGVRALHGRPLKDFARRMLSDEIIETRADMVMAALAPAAGRRA